MFSADAERISIDYRNVISRFLINILMRGKLCDIEMFSLVYFLIYFLIDINLLRNNYVNFDSFQKI